MNLKYIDKLDRLSEIIICSYDNVDVFSQKLYNICERSGRMSEIKNKILNRINEKKYGAFTSSDFVDLDNYKLISKTLEKLEDEKILTRARRGVYYLTKHNDLLDIDEAPDINEIALAIARQFNIVIIPSGNYALNIIGLSTQVPSKYIYITNGPYNEYEIGNNKIYFKRSTSREIVNIPYNILVSIQALKTLRKENIDDNIRNKISCFLSAEDKEYIKNNNLRITSWIYNELKMIGGLINV